MATCNVMDKLKELCNQSTPGPWVFKDGLTWLPTASGGIEHDDSAICHGKNGKFIATARQALPALIDYCEALEKQEQARSIMDKNEIRYDPCCFYQSQKDYKAATAAVEAAKARLEEVCPKK